MAVRTTYRNVNEAQVLANEWQLGESSNSVKVTIYNMDSNAVDTASTAMTNETGGLFSYSWTPTSSATYRIDYYNETLDSHDYEVTMVRGSATTTPSGGSGGSTLTTLRNKFLKLIDNYNAADLSGTNSSGQVADLCINAALQTIYSQIKQSRYLDAYASTALVSVASQAYINLSGISDLDDLFAIKDTDNQYTLEEIPTWKYFVERPDPTQSTGTPYRFCRIFNRIYLDPIPTAVITYTTQYKKLYPELSSDSDQALIPTKFDRWIIDEARVIWLMGEDPNAVSAIQIAQSERDKVADICLSDIASQFARASRSESAFGGYGMSLDPYDHVV